MATTCATGAATGTTSECTLSSAEQTLVSRIPTRFGTDTCQRDPGDGGSQYVTAAVSCSLVDHQAPPQYVEVVSFPSPNSLDQFLVRNSFDLDFSGFPAGRCGVDATHASTTWSAGQSGRLFCDATEARVMIVWTYDDANVLMVAYTSPTHLSTTVAGLLGWFTSGDVLLNNP